MPKRRKKAAKKSVRYQSSPAKRSRKSSATTASGATRKASSRRSGSTRGTKGKAATRHGGARKSSSRKSSRVGGALDPRLRTLVSRERKEKPSALHALRAQGPGVLQPSSISSIPMGVVSVAGQSSQTAAAQMFAEDVVPVLVHVDDEDGSEAAMQLEKQASRWKARWRRLSHSTLSLQCPRSKVGQLSRLPGVRFVEANSRLRPLVELAHRSANLQTPTGGWTVNETGEGVLVGIVDTGIDASHPGFGTGAQSRIIDYLDQEGGQHHTQAQIAAGAASASPDVIGHGTHVAGIAAGSGAGSTSRQYEGVAPGADLAVVKTTFDTVAIAEGVAHIFELADQRQVPCVVNLSLGGHYGPHDGSTVLERTIDQLSGTGRIVVVSAGNEGDSSLHAHAELKAGDRWVSRFQIRSRVIQGQLVGSLLVQVWHNREDDLRIQLRTPNGELIEVAAGQEIEVDRSVFFVSASHQRAVYSDDHSTTFEIFTVAQDQWLNGWSIIAEERSAGGIRAGCLHAWILDERMGGFQTQSRSHLVGMPGTAYSAITVASYATRKQWNSQDGAVDLQAMNLEDISYFSSPGPTRDGHNKPEIAAPGQWLISALSGDATLDEIPAWLRLPGGKYAAMQGTSMSAPYVTGTIALLLERKPDLDWSEVKRRLIKSAKLDTQTGCAWNPRWGYGKLDVERLLSVEPE